MIPVIIIVTLTRTICLEKLTLPAVKKNFDDERAQRVFDDWMISLSALNRKMLSVLLFQSFRGRQKMSVHDAALETASITGFNENYRKEFYTHKGKEEKRGKYKR